MLISSYMESVVKSMQDVCKSSSWYIWRVISSFIDQKIWKLENMLQHFKQELSAEECCSSLVDEKQPSRCSKT